MFIIGCGITKNKSSTALFTSWLIST